MRRQANNVVVNPTNPEAAAQCDRCGKWYNRSELVWQTQWAGNQLFNTGALVCFDDCFDTPNEQLRTIILPPDPPPIINARVPNLVYEENGPVQTTLTVAVEQGEVLLPVVSAAGFAVGGLVWVQLDNATFGQFELASINTDTNTLTLTAPLSYSAPYTGSVTASIVGA